MLERNFKDSTPVKILEKTKKYNGILRDEKRNFGILCGNLRQKKWVWVDFGSSENSNNNYSNVAYYEPITRLFQKITK